MRVRPAAPKTIQRTRYLAPLTEPQKQKSSIRGLLKATIHYES